MADPKNDKSEETVRALVTESHISYSGPRIGDNERGYYHAAPGEVVSLARNEFDQFKAKGVVQAAA